MFDFLKAKPKADAKTTSAEGKSGPADNLVASASHAASELADSAAQAVGMASPASGKYTVKAGDSLSKIAKAHNVPLKQLIAANPQIKNPDLIHPREVINLG